MIGSGGRAIAVAFAEMGRVGLPSARRPIAGGAASRAGPGNEACYGRLDIAFRHHSVWMHQVIWRCPPGSSTYWQSGLKADDAPFWAHASDVGADIPALRHLRATQPRVSHSNRSCPKARRFNRTYQHRASSWRVTGAGRAHGTRRRVALSASVRGAARDPRTKARNLTRLALSERILHESWSRLKATVWLLSSVETALVPRQFAQEQDSAFRLSGATTDRATRRPALGLRQALSCELRRFASEGRVPAAAVADAAAEHSTSEARVRSSRPYRSAWPLSRGVQRPGFLGETPVDPRNSADQHARKQTTPNRRVVVRSMRVAALNAHTLWDQRRMFRRDDLGMGLITVAWLRGVEAFSMELTAQGLPQTGNLQGMPLADPAPVDPSCHRATTSRVCLPLMPGLAAKQRSPLRVVADARGSRNDPARCHGETSDP